MDIQLADSGNIVAIIISALVIGYFLYHFIVVRKRMNKPPSENIRTLTDENFDSVVRNGVSLVDFWAAWCGPCRVQGPIVDEVADEMGTKASICKLDVDRNKKAAGKFGVQSIPTMMIFKNGKPVQKFVGVKPKHVLINAINSYL